MGLMGLDDQATRFGFPIRDGSAYAHYLHYLLTMAHMEKRWGYHDNMIYIHIHTYIDIDMNIDILTLALSRISS